MNESLLEGLASEAKREQELSPLEEELGRYSASDIEPSRLDELRQRALRDRGLRALLEAHRPFSAAERQQLLRGVKQALAMPAGEPPPSAIEPPSGQKFHALRLWPLLAPVAAAAGLALWLGSSAPTSEVGWPRYQLEARQGSAEYRDGPPTLPASSDVLAAGAATAGRSLRLERSGRLTVILRPERATSARPAVFIFVSHPGGDLEPWAHQEERASSGALQLTLTRLSELPAGGELIVVLHAAADADAARALSLARGAVESGPDWQRWVLRFDTARQ